MPNLSPYFDLNDEARRLGGKLPLTWVKADSASRTGNFGDTLSAVVAAAISGVVPRLTSSQAETPRLAAIGTIGQTLRRGTAHIWGTGFDPKLRAFGDTSMAFAAAPDTRYVVHAVRGAHSRQLLLENGIHAPPIYGDPGWFLPRIRHPRVEKTIELGVIPHISAMAEKSVHATPRPEQTRLQVSGTDGVKIVHTFHDSSWSGFQAKLAELLACRRIVTTSFHGLILADVFRIPCLYFPLRNAPGHEEIPLERGRVGLDSRMADFYAGAGRRSLHAYGQPPKSTTDWQAVMRAVDAHYQPLTHPGEATLLEAFPFQKVVSIDDADWQVPDALMEQLPW
ncbi:hypothetical protein BKE38_21610 [Pseudoroseomonas deserti]|uniref:Polysaccharide pyruvyl transferase domain-containing protein n=1 Tax=Teichococcus deserti TaxID=1817963 RepID=A0A1V2GXQ1_9PROT|nr:polysaccharide pyruvyl transferase family protein [Pseudoroseomonas deserti]ONG48673.1 hypothetical protein BKE38_21610 [Pseudoroseomonas deserti]